MKGGRKGEEGRERSVGTDTPLGVLRRSQLVCCTFREKLTGGSYTQATLTECRSCHGREGIEGVVVSKATES